MFDQFELDILYDISAGCRRRCNDCVIAAPYTMSHGGTKQFGNLLDQSSSSFWLGNCWLGPTDIFASNQSIGYTDPEVIEIATKFTSVILSTSLLGRNQDIEQHARLVAEHYQKVNIKLAIPVNLDQVDNQKYRLHIWSKINLFEQALGRRLGSGNRRVYFIGNLPTAEDNVDPDIFHKFVHDWGVPLDIAIGNGRAGLDQLRPVFDRAKEFFLHRINLTNNLPASLSHEGRGLDLLYRNGDLYFLPFYNERLAVLDPQFQLLKDQEWTVGNMINDINNLMIESLNQSEKLTHCKSCNYNSRCSRFLLPLLQQRLGIDTCVQPRELLELNGTYNQTH
jgi:hypothetical protein